MFCYEQQFHKGFTSPRNYTIGANNLSVYLATEMILNNNNHNVNKHKPRLMYIIDGIFR